MGLQAKAHIITKRGRGAQGEGRRGWSRDAPTCAPTPATSPLWCVLSSLALRAHHGPLQLRHPRDHREDRLLRARTLRQDDEPAVHLRLAAVEKQDKDALAGADDRPHAVLRLSPPR